MEYYSVFKRMKFRYMLQYRLNLEYLILSEISQAQKDKYCMIPLI